MLLRLVAKVFGVVANMLWVVARVFGLSAR